MPVVIGVNNVRLNLGVNGPFPIDMSPAVTAGATDVTATANAAPPAGARVVALFEQSLDGGLTWQPAGQMSIDSSEPGTYISTMPLKSAQWQVTATVTGSRFFVTASVSY